MESRYWLCAKGSTYFSLPRLAAIEVLVIECLQLKLPNAYLPTGILGSSCIL